jgi:hypothetical protein
MPRGSRPARTVVGAAFGTDTVNELTAPIQAQAVEALGLGYLAKLAEPKRADSARPVPERLFSHASAT